MAELTSSGCCAPAAPTAEAGDDVREVVRERYAAAARAAGSGGGCCSSVSNVVISNCVINLAADKDLVFAEAARVLKAGGRLAVSDVIADAGMDDATRADMAAWTGCIAGALTREEYEGGLRAVGFDDVEITATHRVHEHAASATIRARKTAA